MLKPQEPDHWKNCYDEDDEGKIIQGYAETFSNNYQYIDGLIYYKKKLYVPKSLREGVLKENHDNNPAGHGGLLVTQKRLEKYYWPDMLYDIRGYVLGCKACQNRKVDRLPPAGRMLRFLLSKTA